MTITIPPGYRVADPDTPDSDDDCTSVEFETAGAPCWKAPTTRSSRRRTSG